MARSYLIFGLISLLLVSSSLGSSVDVPFIVAHKRASLTRLKSGAEHVSVSVDIYNQGSSTAYDVILTDDSWPQDLFEVVSGNTSISWERLDAGGLLMHSFELEGKAKGLFYGAPAVITFRIPTKAALQVWICNNDYFSWGWLIFDLLTGSWFRKHTQLQSCL
ncbi:hypothetical protein I3843_04G002400 [Carya illinoinensis]|uniref:Uncharacterized protein n=1 Tax=Carya illinoinensis TaxID=32201 RepID=A0A922F7E2_CARIL|nr:hypothetical protein I3760_04G002300 [Carya illinoinensis]KAG6715587.1 hypothetical protein I3842_04G002500 [Carya illinoinensis]KAG7981555.1 hypothetical protein I3843_04G002400 [Carya illinoinensis]